MKPLLKILTGETHFSQQLRVWQYSYNTQNSSVETVTQQSEFKKKIYR
jgi:hypothetical protein